MKFIIFSRRVSWIQQHKNIFNYIIIERKIVLEFMGEIVMKLMIILKYQIIMIIVMNNYDNNHKVNFMRTSLCYLHFNYKDKNLSTK